MKSLLLTSLFGAAAGASSLTTYHMVHETGASNGRFEMQVLPHEQAVVTLDRETGVVKYIYAPSAHVPPAQWSVEFKPGSNMAQVLPPEPPKPR